MPYEPVTYCFRIGSISFFVLIVWLGRSQFTSLMSKVDVLALPDSQYYSIDFFLCSDDLLLPGLSLEMNLYVMSPSALCKYAGSLL
jgi:hypothetical protein